MPLPEHLLATQIAAARGIPLTRRGLRYDRVVPRVRRDLLSSAESAPRRPARRGR